MKTLNWPQAYVQTDGYLLKYSSILDTDYSVTGPIYYSSERLGVAFNFWRRSIMVLKTFFTDEVEVEYASDELTYNQIKLILETLNGSSTLEDFVDSLRTLSSFGLENYFNVENPRFYQAYISGADTFDVYIDVYLHIDLVNEKFRWYYYDYRDSDVFLLDKSLTGLSKLMSREGLV
jgi:hypothetical protein